MILLLACAHPDPGFEPPAGDTAPALDCDALPALPLEADTRRGFTGSEDFAFDLDGNVVAVDENGNLVREDAQGHTSVWVPGFGEASGIRFLPGGDLVVGSPWEGAIYRVTPDGSSWVLLGGLAYPNGVDVDADGFVYVSEQTAGAVRRVDPETGDWTYVATGLYNPNGITFSDDFQTMYVGSFGDGTVTAIPREGDGWGEPYVYAHTTDAPYLERGLTCTGLAEGDTCFLDYGGVGVCDAMLACVDDPTPCATAGDTCTTSLLGSEVTSVCTADDDGALFCPRLESTRIDACVDAAEYGSCSFDGHSGYCLTSWEGVMGCVTESEYYDAYYVGCEALAEGDACVGELPTGPWGGTCQTDEYYGSGGLLCTPPGGFGERGGLDGINMDQCGNLYVTEYIKGDVWRFTGPDAEAELVAELRSSWIPNLHWGLGVGGFEDDVLYVADRERGRLFELPVGVGSKTQAYGE